MLNSKLFPPLAADLSLKLIIASQIYGSNVGIQRKCTFIQCAHITVRKRPAKSIPTPLASEAKEHRTNKAE